MKCYYTVVYEVDGGPQVSQDWLALVRPLFLKDSAPISITLIATGDLVSQVETLMKENERAA